MTMASPWARGGAPREREATTHLVCFAGAKKMAAPGASFPDHGAKCPVPRAIVLYCSWWGMGWWGMGNHGSASRGRGEGTCE